MTQLTDRTGWIAQCERWKAHLASRGVLESRVQCRLGHNEVCQLARLAHLHSSRRV